MPHGGMVRAHLIVRGRVRGVFFRATMREVALEAGVNGWVRNLPDGRSVEAVIEGPWEAVRRVLCWAMEGPPAARVEEYHVEFEPARGDLRGFVIRYD